ncbi:hypothetical protein D3C87_162070 [compost metagenome]
MKNHVLFVVACLMLGTGAQAQERLSRTLPKQNLGMWTDTVLKGSQYNCITKVVGCEVETSDYGCSPDAGAARATLTVELQVEDGERLLGTFNGDKCYNNGQSFFSLTNVSLNRDRASQAACEVAHAAAKPYFCQQIDAKDLSLNYKKSKKAEFVEP